MQLYRITITERTADGAQNCVGEGVLAMTSLDLVLDVELALNSDGRRRCHVSAIASDPAAADAALKAVVAKTAV